MRVYISVDIEGVCGATTWDEATIGGDGYDRLRRQMTAEATAACQGALEAGAKDIVVRDAHDTGCNIIAEELPAGVSLVRGWSRHPYMMMQELDSSFSAVVLVGYHSWAGGAGNPLAHTMNTSRNYSAWINGSLASEFLINYYTAMLEEVPVVFLSGDRELCDQAKVICPTLRTVAVKTGSGGSTVNRHPRGVLDEISSGVARSLSDRAALRCRPLPDHFEVELEFVNHRDAYKASFYPGAAPVSSRTVAFSTENYFEVLRFFLFTL